MRGCLFVLVLAASVVGVAAWFGSPLLASSVVDAALVNAGYRADSSTVTTTADPPPKLLLGRADRVRIVGTGVDFRTFHAARLDIVLTDVDVFARTAGGISGRIEGAELKTLDGQATTAEVKLAGTGRAAVATISVAAATIDRVVREGFRRQSGLTVSGTQLIAPDILRISASGSTIEGRLGIHDESSITLSTRLGSSTILELAPSFPLQLRAVEIVDGNLQIDALLDAEALFRDA